MGLTIFSFTILLGVLVFFHEFGHFIAARLLGVGVETFSLGFGPRLIGRKIGMTDYRISAIPLGGYVKMVGEDPESGEEPEDITISFSHKPVWRRMLIVAAGPAFNLVLAVLLFFFIYMIVGADAPTTYISEVMQDSPAQKAGVLAGDRIVSINGNPISQWEDVSALVSGSEGAPLDLELYRSGETVHIAVAAEKAQGKNMFGEEVEYYRVGVLGRKDITRNPAKVAWQALANTYNWSVITIQVVVKMVTGHMSAKNLGGPIAIAQLSGETARAGILQFLGFMAVLSVNLGLINLFPIPILDGGHLVFFALEGIRRKPLSIRAREIAMQVGLALLVMLMAFVFYNDIVRVIAGKPLGPG